MICQDPNNPSLPDGARDWADVAAASDCVDLLIACADGRQGNSPWWYGWALRMAFLMGVKHASEVLP